MSFNGLISISPKNDRNLVSQTNFQTNSGPFCNEWFDQTHDKISTVVESVVFTNSFTMLDHIQCESLPADGIYRKKKTIEPCSNQRQVTDLQEYFEIF